MIKICDESIASPLKIIFDTALKSGIFPEKENKNIFKNYRPISLLPVCGRIFEKCIYNSLYSYLESNDILSKSLSGFRKGDSCISQLLAITHEIYSNSDACPSLETRGVFIDISKAFDRVWHEEILAGVPQGSILGPLLFLIFINDIPKGIQSNIKIFADDTSIFSVMTDKISASVTLMKI